MHMHTSGGHAFPGLPFDKFLRKVNLATCCSLSCVAKTSLFFSLTVLGLGFL